MTKTPLLLIFIAQSLAAVSPGDGFGAPVERPEEPLTLEAAISRAMGANPDVAAARARADAEHSAIRSETWLDNPTIGLMHESNLNFMEQQMGPMSLWSISQDVKFPTKYVLLGSAQRSRAQGADQETDAKKLEIRVKVIAGYYDLFATDRVLALLQAQKEALSEVARAAESRHATGAVPQQDEMKAHVEQTKIENELILAREERISAEAALNGVLNRDAQERISLSEKELPVPRLNVAVDEIPKISQAKAKRIKQQELAVEEAGSRKTLASMSYAPDFKLSYRRAYLNAPDNAFAANLEMTIPLWFFAKQTSEVSQASSRQIEAEKNLERTIRDLNADARALATRVSSREKLLQIYQTALIPQATTTLNSSRAAYQAGRAGFIELLDSERTLYETRIAYYRNLSQYVEALAKLEELASSSLSTLPFGDLHEK